MRATITKIDVTRRGTDEEFYQAVYFRLEGGGAAKTHLCTSFKNFARWHGCLEVGALLDNLKMKTENIVDADSYPRRLPQLKQKELF